jgi:hypothetical protein
MLPLIPERMVLAVRLLYSLGKPTLPAQIIMSGQRSALIRRDILHGAIRTEEF